MFPDPRVQEYMFAKTTRRPNRSRLELGRHFLASFTCCSLDFCRKHYIERTETTRRPKLTSDEDRKDRPAIVEEAITLYVVQFTHLEF